MRRGFDVIVLQRFLESFLVFSGEGCLENGAAELSHLGQHFVLSGFYDQGERS
jgi:hypothetical protein